MPGVGSASTEQAGRLDLARRDLKRQLVLVLDVVAVGVRAQYVPPASLPMFRRRQQRLERRAAVDVTAVPPSSSATTYAFES